MNLTAPSHSSNIHTIFIQILDSVVHHSVLELPPQSVRRNDGG
jgi:hypothetical protein